MLTNVGTRDRIVRLVLGAALLVVGVAGYAGFVTLAWLGIGQALAAVVVAVAGAILLVTGALRTCPLYALLGISTIGQPPEREPMVEKPA